MRFIFLLAFLFLCQTSAYSVEILVLMEDGLHSTHMKAGDIASLREDGHDWESSCLACQKDMWVIIRVPSVSLEDAKIYLEAYEEEITENINGVDITRKEMIKERRWGIEKDYMDSIKSSGLKYIDINKGTATAFLNKIVDKKLLQ